MILRQAFKYRLKAKFSHQSLMKQYAGCCRYLWNKCLILQKEKLDAGEYIYSYHDLAMMLPAWKKEFPFLGEAPSQPLQQTLKNLDRALKDAFNKKSPKAFPVFKKKYISQDSFRYPQGFKIEGKNIFLPKIGWVGFRKSRQILGVPKNVTVSRKGNHWYVSIQTEREVAETKHPSSSIIGGDRGIAKFLTLSDGTSYEALNAFRKMETKLRKEQQKLSKKTKKSKNWSKQKSKISRLHIKIADMRNDYLHKISNAISKSHAAVVLEDLKVKNMSASAAGTKEEPGKLVKQKSGLNKAILDQGWGNFRQYLEYKQARRGGLVLYVNPAYTSQTCSGCGHKHPENRKSQAEFVCQACGLTMNADHNAALNILRAGHARLACQASGETVPPATGTLKQAA